MNNNEKTYKNLQQHLNRQAVGFPATNIGAEIKILKHIFSPIEAKVAICLSFRPEPIQTIYKKAQNIVKSEQELSEILDSIEKKGGLEVRIKKNEQHYCNAPLVVGMYEYQLDRLTPEFRKDFKEYTSDKKFGLEFLSTELPQMRTIPISKSIAIKSNVSTFDEVVTLLKESNKNFAICECICRKKKRMEGEHCNITDRRKTCLAVGDLALTAVKRGIGRAVNMKEAISILEKNQKDGLILQPSNTQQAEFICSCCGCCCGMLKIHKSLPKPVDLWASNFYAKIESDICNGCGICEKKCQVNAVKLSKKTLKVVDRNRCLGCGLCVPGCPKKAVVLQKKDVLIEPPITREDLYDIIMAKKKGKFGKLKLVGKLLKDILTTGQTHLLKR